VESHFLIPKPDFDSEKILFSIPTPIPKIIFFRLRLRKIFFHDSDSNSDSEKFCLRDSDSIGVRCSSLVFGLHYFNIDKWNIHCSIKLYVRDFHGSGRFFNQSARRRQRFLCKITSICREFRCLRM